MVVIPPHDATIIPDDQIDYQLRFADRALRNAQDLVRFLDQKAGLTITAVSILTTALGAVLLRALGAAPPGFTGDIVRATIGTAILTYMLMAFAVIANATRVLSPSMNTLRPNTQAPGLFFPLMVLSRTGGDEDVYLRLLRGATPDQLLHDLANQILEVSNVYQTKQRQLDRALRRFRWLSMLWILVMLLLSVAIALF